MFDPNINRQNYFQLCVDPAQLKQKKPPTKYAQIMEKNNDLDKSSYLGGGIYWPHYRKSYSLGRRSIFNTLINLRIRNVR